MWFDPAGAPLCHDAHRPHASDGKLEFLLDELRGPHVIRLAWSCVRPGKPESRDHLICERHAGDPTDPLADRRSRRTPGHRLLLVNYLADLVPGTRNEAPGNSRSLRINLTVMCPHSASATACRNHARPQYPGSAPGLPPHRPTDNLTDRAGDARIQ